VSTTPGARLERAYFDDLYRRDPDPWDFATSDYERDKYSDSLAALGDRGFGRALEVGCSIGVFTEALARSCRELVAVDMSPAAVASARERTAGLENVDVREASMPEDMPAGRFDLIVCSEVLYYWDQPLLEAGLATLTAGLEPGGLLLAVHWTEPTREYPLQGHEVHRTLTRHPGLVPVYGHDRTHYRLDLLRCA
jgi:SAM-dependent methyltransferase